MWVDKAYDEETVWWLDMNWNIQTVTATKIAKLSAGLGAMLPLRQALQPEQMDWRRQMDHRSDSHCPHPIHDGYLASGLVALRYDWMKWFALLVAFQHRFRPV